jgi:Tol biopolymer transport system component
VNLISKFSSQMTLRFVLTGVILLILSVVTAQAEYNTVTMVSMTNSNPGNDDSGYEGLDMSGDGRYIVYSSNASNLVASDHFTCHEYADSDIFVYDRLTQQNTLMTVSSTGMQGTVTSFNYLQHSCVTRPSISDNGRFITFGSIAENLVSGDTNQRMDLYLHDRDVDEDGLLDEPGAISTIRINPQAAEGLYSADISGDGRYVAFRYAQKPVMAYDRLTGQSIDVETAGDGTPGNLVGSLKGEVRISATGRYITFFSRATNLVSGDTSNADEIFLRDRDPDNNGLFDEPGKVTVERVILTAQGMPVSCTYCFNYTPALLAISGDGRSVAFSFDEVLINGVFGMHIYVRDRQTQKTILISKASDGTPGNDNSYLPSISADGRFVTFASVSSNLLVGQTTSTEASAHVFMHDRDADSDGIYDEAGAVTTALVTAGLEGNSHGGGQWSATSNDGSMVAFSSHSANMVDNDPVICPESALITCSDIFYAARSISAPTNLTAAKITNIQIDLAWTDNALDETNYRVERKQEGESWQEIAVLPANVTKYTDHDLSCGIYQYRVKAYRGSDNLFSRRSNVATAEEISCDEAILLVSPLDDATVNTHPTLQWVAYPGAVQYKIRIRDFFDENVFNATFDASSLCVSGICALDLRTQVLELTTDEEYVWRIQAKGDFGKVKSPVRAFNTNFAVPGAFTLMTPAADSTIDTLTPVFSWQEATNADEYRIRVKDSFDDTKMLKLNLTPQQANCANGICSIDSSLFDYRHPLEDGEEYLWRVQARNSLGKTKSSKWAFEIDLSTKATRLPLP